MDDSRAKRYKTPTRAKKYGVIRVSWGESQIIQSEADGNASDGEK